MFFSKLKVAVGVIALNTVCLHAQSYALTIEFEYDTPLHQNYKNTINQAATKWSNAITTTFTPRDEQRSDVVIRVSVTNIDGEGGTLAQARPTHFFQTRADDPLYTYRGEMTIDIADLKNPGLYNIVTHEIAHAIGFGTLWGKNGLVKLFNQNDPCFIGQNAMRYYTQLKGAPALQPGKLWAVPVENTGGTGTSWSHWLESVFANELMTGYYNEDQINPLSRITLASFADMGYTVNYNHADPYTLPTSTTALIGASLGNYARNRKPYHNCTHPAASGWCNLL